VTSKPRRLPCLGIGLGDTYLPPRWCPAYRWRELGSGFRAERENLSSRNGDLVVTGKARTLLDGERENLKRQEPREAEYRSRGTGADRLVVAMKPGNAGRAKGAGHPGLFGGQLHVQEEPAGRAEALGVSPVAWVARAG
jgi:hypothetical protein